MYTTNTAIPNVHVTEVLHDNLATFLEENVQERIYLCFIYLFPNTPFYHPPTCSMNFLKQKSYHCI